MSELPIPFTEDPLDRLDEVRGDTAAVAALWSSDDARVLVLWRGRPLVDDSDGTLRPVLLPPDALPGDVLVRLLLGRHRDGSTVLAASLDPAHPPTPTHGRFEDLRPIAARLSLDDASIVGTARSVFAWHRSHRFCASCGEATDVVHAGWKRRCASCEREHFPRVDPVVIALITRGDRVLLGRGPKWPPGFFSCLAGFVEPGETVGDATRREAWEEAKVRLGDVQYLFSQPWPFPASMMLGVQAEAMGEEVTVDGVELAEARWFSRDEVVAMFDGTHPDATPPFSFAVAHHLLRWWLEHPG